MAHNPMGMILTAGFGTRLRPLSLLRPKPVMEIGAKPIIHFLVRMLEKAGVKDIFMNLHHQSEGIRKVVDEMNAKARIHLVCEKEILGTAGGMANVIRNYGIRNRQLVVIHGDIICDIDLSPYLERNDFCTLICARDHTVPGYAGSVGVDRKGNIIELGRFYKGAGDVKERGFFTGIHILSPDAVAKVGESVEKSLVAEVYPWWLNCGFGIKGVVREFYYDDLGTAARIFHANMDVVHGAKFKFIDVHENFVRMPQQDGIYVGHDVKIATSATLVPPVFIGSRARIDAGATVGPNAIVGERAAVGANAIIKNSVILSRTTIEKDEVLDCMIGLSSARVLVKGSRR